MTTNRFSVIVAVSIIAALALLTISMVAAPRSAVTSSSNAYLTHRQGEWTAGASAQQAYLDQRHGEQTTGQAVAAAVSSYDQIELLRVQRYSSAAARQAYLDQRHGEQMAGISSALANLAYRRGEWSGK